MCRVMILLISSFIVSLSLWSTEPNADAVNYWPQWRGPFGTGAAPTGNPPVEWSEQQNIRWKIRLSGTGYSTPVIWGNDIFVSAAIPPEGNAPSGGGATSSEPVKFVVMAIDRSSGQVRWERLAREEVPHEGLHRTSTWATSSPITDGERVYAYFGSRGLYCYTIAGDLLWEKDFGDMRIRREFGEGSSPALYKNRLIVNWDHEGQSFIVALDAVTGEQVWKKNRDEVTSWATPLIVEVAGQAQIIQCATNHVRSYNLATGDLIWEDDGLTIDAVPTPVTANGIVYVTSGYKVSVMRAIRLAGAKGDISGSSAIVWSYNENAPYIPSPLLLGNSLYFLKDTKGFLTCLDVSTGKPHYSNQRLNGINGVYSSPVGVQDRVYVLGRDGVTLTLRHGPEFTVMATNTLDDKFDASPVIVGDELYLRGYKYLYCIAR